MDIGLTAIIIAGLFDVYTTNRAIKLPGLEEGNPLVRRLFGPKPKLLPMLAGKAAAVGLLLWFEVGTLALLIGAGIWGVVSLNNLKLIRRREGT